MNNVTAGTLNTTLARDYVCAQCWGALVERHINGEFTIVCPRGCQPGGFVTAEYAARRRSNDLADFYEVVANYPQLDSRPKLSAEQKTRDLQALFA